MGRVDDRAAYRRITRLRLETPPLRHLLSSWGGARGPRRHAGLAAGGAGARPDLPARPVALPRAVDARSSTPTAACCAPSRRPTASGGSRPRSTTSIRSISPAQGLRGPPLRRSLGRRSAGGGARRRPVDRARPHRVGRLDASPCRPPACSSRRPRGARSTKADPVGARPAARMALLQARGAGDLPDPGADGRQPRGRARRLLRLFRQGAQAAQRRRSRPARRHPAIARAPPARPLAGRRRRPRAIACWRAACSTA